jgi:hypothetical protein
VEISLRAKWLVSWVMYVWCPVEVRGVGLEGGVNNILAAVVMIYRGVSDGCGIN